MPHHLALVAHPRDRGNFRTGIKGWQVEGDFGALFRPLPTQAGNQSTAAAGNDSQPVGNILYFISPQEFQTV